MWWRISRKTESLTLALKQSICFFLFLLNLSGFSSHQLVQNFHGFWELTFLFFLQVGNYFSNCFPFISEVDDNVTRHLDRVLKREDWDLLILHYLGLDHIGHVTGPNSPLVGPKLREMDNILKKIHISLLSKVIYLVWDQSVLFIE